MSFQTLLQIILAVAVVRALSAPLFQSTTREQFFRIWSRFRWWMVPAALATMGATIGAALVITAAVPILNIGWGKLVFGQDTNVFMAPVQVLDTAGQGGGSAGAMWAALGISVFLAGLLYLMPLLAMAEEEMFRKNKLTQSAIIKSSVVFGLIHSIAGIPIGWALAISIPGVVMCLVYRRRFQELTAKGMLAKHASVRALDDSACFHALFNSILVVAGIAITWLEAILLR